MQPLRARFRIQVINKLLSFLHPDSPAGISCLSLNFLAGIIGQKTRIYSNGDILL